MLISRRRPQRQTRECQAPERRLPPRNPDRDERTRDGSRRSTSFGRGRTKERYDRPRALRDAVAVNRDWNRVDPDTRSAARKGVRRCRNGDSSRRPRTSNETSGRVRIVNPAGLVNAAVASSARPANALPSARLRAPGLRKSNCSGICRLPCAAAPLAVINTIPTADSARRRKSPIVPLRAASRSGQPQGASSVAVCPALLLMVSVT